MLASSLRKWADTLDATISEQRQVIAILLWMYEKDAYNEAKTWEFLNSIWKNHDPIFGGDGFMPGRQRDYWGR